jgi:RNA polymerase sigma-70 factor (ECF subfamily)
LGDSQLSDDLAQDTFLKAYTNIASFRGLASFQTWIMRIAYNVFYDYTRKRQLAVSDWQLAESQQPTANSQQPLKMDLYAALALLKPDERTCITLQLIDGYDIAGIAKITGLKEGTVKSHLSRGKEKLANYLRQNGYDGR